MANFVPENFREIWTKTFFQCEYKVKLHLNTVFGNIFGNEETNCFTPGLVTERTKQII